MKLSKALVLPILFGLLWSCQPEDISQDTNTDENKQTTNEQTTRNLMGSEVPVLKQNDGTYLVGGQNSDIIAFEENFDGDHAHVNPEPMVPGRSAITLGGSGQVRKWPNNTVIYRIDNLTSTMRDRFNQAMKEWETKTDIRFKERTNEKNYVTVSRTGDNCSCGVATIGMFQNRGFIRIGSQAPLSVIVHEIGHTLGYLHEQSRPDRDQYVNVLFENITNGAEDQFFISRNSIPLTKELDLNSIMMYGSYTFSKDRRSPTIVDKNGNAYRKSTPGLSQGDIDGTNQAYPPLQETEEEEDTTTTTTTEEEEEEDTTTTTTTTTEEEEKEDTTTTTTNTDTEDVNNSSNACSNVRPYSRNTFYRVGDKVTFRGYLFQRDFSRWILLGSCEEVKSKDICEGVSEYNRFVRYTIGNRVTYRGGLYRRAANRWIFEGQCDN